MSEYAKSIKEVVDERSMQLTTGNQTGSHASVAPNAAANVLQFKRRSIQIAEDECIHRAPTLAELALPDGELRLQHFPDGSIHISIDGIYLDVEDDATAAAIQLVEFTRHLHNEAT
ncbi:hypothetical protein AB3X91_11910 [Paraburkholderia sp. BR14263]|uniref:hypothetical protein n=1 Tax=unclassified Paraburkholderia TaxID=2615204 RepID=UPI0034CF40EC